MRLFGTGPVEDIPCVLIGGDGDTLKWEAMDAHERWLRTPDSLDAKITFANRLYDWAKYIRNKKAKAYALSLGAEREVTR